MTGASNRPGMRLFTSNRLEHLAARLAETAGRSLPSAFQAEVVVVQSQGMARWLQLELSRRLGICAHVRFPFPESFAWEVFRALDPALPKEPPTDPKTTVWRLMRLLPALRDRPEFAPVRHYLSRDDDGRRRFQLAQRVARLLDDYALYRPEMILAWDAGEGGDWQSVLWREMQREVQGEHSVALRARCLERLGDLEAPPSGLPPRVSVFGITALPPFYVELFERLSATVELNFFSLQPAKQYWGDISSARGTLRSLRRQGRHTATPSSLHYHAGNSLLASLGHQGRDFLNVLLSLTEFNAQDEFVDPSTNSVLATLQSDILNLRDRGSDECPPLPIAPGDDSVQIHSCHSPLRELEVLRDRMLDWFARDPSLAPRDVLVMVPEIERYAPFVKAVFAGEEGDPKAIPFSIADQGSNAESHLSNSFLALLRLAGSRLGAAAVLELLEAPPVRRRFELEESDLFRVQGWLKRAGVRWGRDASHRASLGLPALNENTWREGLDRLVLGNAMDTRRTQLFQKILPCEAVEGQDAELLGRFLAFIEQLFTALRQFEPARPLADWVRLLEATLERFFDENDETEAEWRILRGVLRDLDQRQQQAAFADPVSLAVVLEHLTPALAQDQVPGGFLTGRVTFGALKPMRSIPFKILCLIGLNDTAFPRADRRPAFDRMREAPRLGDQSKREDDRYLFLESLLSARQKLYLSYVGQSIRDNSVAPPSVLVSELMDCLRQSFIPKPGQDVLADPIVFHHRLQAFSPAYFCESSRLFSYSEENFRAAEVLRDQPAPFAFANDRLPDPDDSWRTVSLAQLAEFFTHPARFFLIHRLGVRFPKLDGALAEREPIELDALESYELKADLLEQRLGGNNLHEVFPLLKASGRLPLGQMGEAAFPLLRQRVERFHQRLETYAGGEKLPSPPIDLTVGKFHLTGELPPLRPRGLLQFRPAILKPKDLVRAWVRHVAWNALPFDGKERFTVVLGEETDYGRAGSRFGPVPGALPVLERLLELYWRGIGQPLKFFPASSLAFAEAGAHPGPRAHGSGRDALAKARAQWEGDEFRRGEGDDDYCRLCFGGVDPLDDEFAEMARQVLYPMLEHEERVS